MKWGKKNPEKFFKTFFEEKLFKGSNSVMLKISKPHYNKVLFDIIQNVHFFPTK